MRSKQLVILGGLVVLAIFSTRFSYKDVSNTYAVEAKSFNIQAIDTMKFSRDVAREKLTDVSYNREIEKQVKEIADTGATHIALGTPYDEEFVPYLSRWVNFARRYHLNVWFRGNVSGWEGWFNYPKISSEDHTKLIENFIISNPDLFAEGDIFTPCPECENGGPGDPRNTKLVNEFRQFLITEHKAAEAAFSKINKKVTVGYHSMNGDVARLIMDPATTKELGGVVTIDHYVRTPEKLIEDVRDYIKRSGGKVVLGEFGAPIPDIHGEMTPERQAQWIEKALAGLSEIPEVEGVNYWTARGSSTALWRDGETNSLSASQITSYFIPSVKQFVIKDEIGNVVRQARIMLGAQTLEPKDNGVVSLIALPHLKHVTIQAEGFESTEIAISDLTEEVLLVKTDPGLFYLLVKQLRTILRI